MTTLTTIPLELLVSILESLHSADDLASCLLVCRRFYDAFQQGPRAIAEKIVRQQISPPLLPYAVAVMEWSPHMPPPPDAAATAENDQLQQDDLEVEGFVHRSACAAALARRVREMTVPALAEMSRTHEVVEAAVARYAAQAWSRFLGGGGGGRQEAASAAGDQAAQPPSLPPPRELEPVVLSPDEHVRFGRALYGFTYHARIPGGEVEDVSWERQANMSLWRREQYESLSEFIDAECERVPDPDSYVEGDQVRLEDFHMQFQTFAHYSEKYAHDPSLLWIGRCICAKAWKDGPAINPLALSDEDFAKSVQRRTMDAVWPGKAEKEDYCCGKGAYSAQLPDDGDVPEQAGGDAGPGQQQPTAPGASQNAELRARGYAFWDLERLEKHGLLDRIGVVLADVDETIPFGFM